MRVILIDDEKPALAHIEWLFERDGRLQVAAKFTSARDGIQDVRNTPAQIVFLDINMPGLNGLEAAEHIRSINPDIRIVYITAYSEYAIEAFEHNALDYLLKPVHPERFKKTITRIMEDYSRGKPENQPLPGRQVLCFKRLAFHDDGKTNTSLRLRTLKAQELFAFLLHYKDQWVAKQQLLDTLWPDSDYEKAMMLLHTSVYQIRKLMKDWKVEALVEFALDSYRLTSNGLKLDVEQFELGVAAIRTIDTEQQRIAAEQALSLYAGDYFEEHDFLWARQRRDELRAKYVRFVRSLIHYEMNAGHEQDALKRLLLLHEQEPYSDELCRQVLKLFGQLGEQEALVLYYDDFARLLLEDLNCEPEPETKHVIKQLKGTI